MNKPFAVMRPGAKKATKLLSTEEEAQELAGTIEGAYVELREREYARCDDYCRAASWCTQLANERIEE